MSKQKDYIMDELAKENALLKDEIKLAEKVIDDSWGKNTILKKQLAEAQEWNKQLIHYKADLEKCDKERRKTVAKRDEARMYARKYKRLWEKMEEFSRMKGEFLQDAHQEITKVYGYSPFGLDKRIRKLIAELKEAHERIAELEKLLQGMVDVFEGAANERTLGRQIMTAARNALQGKQ